MGTKIRPFFKTLKLQTVWTYLEDHPSSIYLVSGRNWKGAMRYEYLWNAVVLFLNECVHDLFQLDACLSFSPSNMVRDGSFSVQMLCDLYCLKDSMSI